jgi:hypothetical protein
MRTGNHSQKPAPLTAEQLKEKRAERNDKQARIDARVQQWMESTNELAHSMATEFDMEPRYFLDIFFQGGAHMINHQDVVNPYNAFRGLKSMELRERELYSFHFLRVHLLSDTFRGHCYERPRPPYAFLRRVLRAHDTGERSPLHAVGDGPLDKLPTPP